jgi:hypothetical protein
MAEGFQGKAINCVATKRHKMHLSIQFIVSLPRMARS